MFFIVGVGRSGSTLLQTILDAHRNVMVPPESKIIIYLHSTYLNVKNWTNEIIEQFAEDLYSEAKFRVIWGVDKAELINELKNKKDLDFTTAIQAAYRLYNTPFEKGRIDLIGDKNPVYAHLVPELIQLFPEAKFIHLIRDYHANVESQQRLAPHIKLETHALRWVKLNEHIEEVKRLYTEKFTLVKYEDLVADTSRELKKIFEFLNIPLDDSNLDYFESFNQRLQLMKETSPQQWKLITTVHPNLLKPINSSRLYLWKEKLSEEKIKIIERIAALDGERYGYEGIIKDLKPTSKWTRNRLSYFVWHHSIRWYYKIPLSIRRKLGLVGDTRIEIKDIVVE